jgi:hypothetical protein
MAEKKSIVTYEDPQQWSDYWKSIIQGDNNYYLPESDKWDGHYRHDLHRLFLEMVKGNNKHVKIRTPLKRPETSERNDVHTLDLTQGGIIIDYGSGIQPRVPNGGFPGAYHGSGYIPLLNILGIQAYGVDIKRAPSNLAFPLYDKHEFDPYYPQLPEELEKRVNDNNGADIIVCCNLIGNLSPLFEQQYGKRKTRQNLYDIRKKFVDHWHDKLKHGGLLITDIDIGPELGFQRLNIPHTLIIKHFGPIAKDDEIKSTSDFAILRKIS